MTCSLNFFQQFARYAICSPNLWMVIACTVMTLLTMVLMFYLHHGFKRDLRWLQFAQWKLQQLAERLRFQEPNVTLLERITRKVTEKNYDEAHTFDDFFRHSKESKNPKVKRTSNVAADVKKAKDDDAEKVLREIPTTPAVPTPDTDAAGNQTILRKWTDATKDILAINDDKVEHTQDGQ